MHKHAGPIINAIGYEILTLVSPKKKEKKVRCRRRTIVAKVRLSSRRTWVRHGSVRGG